MDIKVKDRNIRRIDESGRYIEFDSAKCGKITGSRFLAVLGKDGYSTDFKAACQIARLFSEDTTNRYTIAGDVIEPIIRGHVRKERDVLLKGRLCGSCDSISVEEPVEKGLCDYDHFKSKKIFGGLVDGYIKVDGKRYAILEIKTANSTSGWIDENGDFTRVPEGYYLQASLYAELAGLDRIVFAVGFPKDEEYDHPETFVPNDDNFKVLIVDKKDISEEMKTAEAWYREYIMNGRTPEWTDADAELIDAFTTFDIDILPESGMAVFRKYVKLRESGDDTSDVEYTIEEILGPALKPGKKRVRYRFSGYSFEIAADDGRLRITEI